MERTAKASLFLAQDVGYDDDDDVDDVVDVDDGNEKRRPKREN